MGVSRSVVAGSSGPVQVVNAEELEFKNKGAQVVYKIVTRPLFWINTRIIYAVGTVTRRFMQWLPGKYVHMACGAINELYSESQLTAVSIK